MARWAAFLAHARSTGRPRMAVCGGDFFAFGGLEEKLKGEALIRGLPRIGYDAVTLGEMDFRNGAALVDYAIQKLPVVTTNMRWSDTGKLLARPMLLKSYSIRPREGGRRTLRVAVLAFMDPQYEKNANAYLRDEPRQLKVSSPVEAAAEWVPKARASADLVVAFVHMQSDSATKFARAIVPGIDVMITGHASEIHIQPPFQEGSTVIVSNADNGRWAGELLYDFQGGRLSAPRPNTVVLDKTIGEDPASKELVDRFKVDLAYQRAHGEAAAPANAKASSQWATGAACLNCHVPAQQAWVYSAHARAYEALVKNHDEVREECLKCHVLGLGTPGGFDVRNPKMEMANVQCESCHGPGLKHSMAGASDKKKYIVDKPTEQLCRTCHDAKQDPSFKFEVAWPKIHHGL